MNESKPAEQPENNSLTGTTLNTNTDSEGNAPSNNTAESTEPSDVVPDEEANLTPAIEVKLYPAARKDLDSIGKGKHQTQVARKIAELKLVPLPNDAKPMKGEHFKANGWNFYRVDAGEYRIIYDLDEQTNILTIVTIVVIGQRNDDKAYRLLQRRFG